MSEEETLRYDKMVEDALRGVVRQAIELTVKHGLTGDHHFYITFRTHFPGVSMSPALLARHPEEMTIVLQHQFWDLTVDDRAFGVTLSFGGKSEMLSVPLAAITGFADPSAKFGLQFQTVDEDDDEVEDDDFADDETAHDEAAAPSEPADGAGKVVALDAFRKK